MKMQRQQFYINGDLAYRIAFGEDGRPAPDKRLAQLEVRARPSSGPFSVCFRLSVQRRWGHGMHIRPNGRSAIATSYRSRQRAA